MLIEFKSADRPAAPLLRQPGPRPRGTLGARRRRSPGERLLEALATLAQGKARVLSHAESAWASITFAGTRHKVVLEFSGVEGAEAGECFIAFLPEHEFALPGQLVADATVAEVDHQLQPPLMRVTAELLLLEEG
jgi:hypothetical protein